MNRAQKIMTSVMASLAVAGPARTAEILASQTQTQEQPDPRVRKAADEIFRWLEPVYRADAKTMKEIAKRFPQYSPAVIERALKDDRIKVTSDGRYYGHSDSHGG